jgi:phosphatidylserine/phosphatidylglycerophosphate/cardiolipin synthase-like enzyme
MKLQIQLSGIFRRLPLGDAETIPVSLGDLLQEVQAIATHYRLRTPQSIRQSFGLDFIPESVLINLYKEAQGLYQVGSLQLLKPTKSRLNNQISHSYSYQFTSPEVNIPLMPDDPQLPIFTGTIVEQTGSYIITLKQPTHSTQIIWNNSRDYWDNLPSVEKIRYALQSHDLNNFCVNYQQGKIWISIQELSLDLRAAITFLRLNSTDQGNLSNSVRLLVEEYKSRYRYQPIKLPDNLHTNTTLRPHTLVNIRSSNSRHIIRTIISEAHEFLLISSYIIEDEELTELICEKSLQLPQGIWILTDLSNEIIDRIDEQVSDSESVREQYQHTNERKKICLKMLLNANIPIRSGAFHLKTYISEKYGYLGSCNLTRGSLDFNKEAGMIFSNNSQHQTLINLFQQFWLNRSRDEVIPDHNTEGFRLRSLFYSASRNYNPHFLTLREYERDLIEQLRNFQGEVKIYSRSFQPSPELARYLRLLDVKVFIDSVMFNHPTFNIHRINNLHAKITILGRQVAYIGGINFNFNWKHHDLMYKITDAGLIDQLVNDLELYIRNL